MKKYFLMILACLVVLTGCGTKMEKAETFDVQNSIFSQKQVREDNTVLYSLPDDAIDGAIQSEIYRYKNNILVVYDSFNAEEQKSYTHFKLISMKTGEVVCESKQEEFFDCKIQVVNGNLAVHNWGNGTTIVMNEKLETVETYKFEGEAVYFDNKGENVFLFSKNAGITIRNLANNNENKVLENARDMYVYDKSENEVSFTYFDINTKKRMAGYINLADKNIIHLDTPKTLNSVSYSNGTWFGNVNAKGNICFFGSETNKTVFEASVASNVVMCPDTGHLIAFDYEKDENLTGTIYDKDGNFISTCKLDGLMIYLMKTPVWCEEANGYIFTLINEKGQDELLFWDLSTKMEGENLNLYSVDKLTETPKGSAVSQSLYTKADEISKKYGVQILIADQCDTEFQMFKGKKEVKESNISNALKQVEKALSMYPQGFIDQLKYDTYTEIEIHLLGEMAHKLDEMKPIGFIDYNNGTFVMGLDIRGANVTGQPVEEVFYHEMSHMIDHKLEFESEFTNNGYSDIKWREMNPKGFEYSNSNNMYSKYKNYFIDSYGATDSNEDRARILEHASLGWWDKIVSNKPLKAKYDYYCACIRKGFDTTNWPEKTLWEK